MAFDYKTRPKFRQGGSGFTAFQWDGQTIAFARGVSHNSPRPVADPVPIQPLDARYPLQILTPAALGPGQLTVELFEMYNAKVWDRIMEITTKSNTTYNDLVQIFITLAALNRPINCIKVINPPTLNGQKPKVYGDMYHNCVITDIRDDEQINIGTMEIAKNMTIAYTHMTRIGTGKISSTGLAKTGPFDPGPYSTFGY